jgi:glycosyltransferase involved in cell wall biosynthesis
VRVALPGSVQRHFYITRPAGWLRRWSPDAVFVELEPFSIPTLQWGLAAERLGIPWGCQGDENLDRHYPLPAVAMRRWSVPRIDFLAARSPGAVDILRRYGAQSEIRIVPHTIPEWDLPARPRAEGALFTVGFAGRLTEAKGLRDLVRACRPLEFPFRLLVVGDGPLRGELESADLGRGTLDLRTGVRSAAMPELYAQMDLLVLPSRTTPTWAEQFGKVLCEALLCDTPALGSDSGEIPWVIQTSGGGRTFPEGDDAALAAGVSELAGDQAERERLASVGREGVLEHFAPRVAAGALDELMRGAL